MTDSTSRRRFLALAGAGAGTSVAGCNGLLNDGPAATDGPEGGNGDSRQATVAVEPDRQALQTARANVTQRVQSGELEQGEVQQEMVAAQQEIVADAVADAESTIGDSAVSVDDSQDAQGLLLVSGPATGLIDLLEAEAVGGLLEAAAFEEIRQQPGAVPTEG